MASITTLDALRKIIPPPHPLIQAKVLDHLDPQAVEFITRSPFMLLATRSPDGSLEVSPKGDELGFVHVEDSRTLMIPDRVGNNMAIGLTNLLTHPDVGIIFLVPATGDTLRVSGRATLHDDVNICARLAARAKPPKLFLRIAIKHAYFHCARSILRANLWNPDTWTPPIKVSVGRIVRDRRNLENNVAERIDELTEQNYKDENLY